MRLALLNSIIASVFVALSPLLCFGQWTNFPLTEGEYDDWYNLRSTNSPLSQIFLATQERHDAVYGSDFEVVETWLWYGGVDEVQVVETNIVGDVTNVYYYTNTIYLTNGVVTTNALGPVEYEYTDDSGTHTATGFPTVTRAFLQAIDDSIRDMIPHFANTNFYDGNYNGYLSNNATATLPTWDATNLFIHLGVGFVTDDVAWWTKETLVAPRSNIGEAYYYGVTSNWTFRDGEVFPGGEIYGTGPFGAIEIHTPFSPTNIFPVVVYNSGTNAPIYPSLTITGKVYNVADFTVSDSSEAVTLTSSNQALTKAWHDITGITSATSGNDKDTVVVMWTNQVTSYEVSDLQYALNSVYFNERQAVLDELRWTVVEGSLSGTNGRTYIGPDTFYTNISSPAALQALQDDAEAALNNPSNWTNNFAYIIETSMYFDQYTNSWSSSVTIDSGVKNSVQRENISPAGSTNLAHSAEVYAAYSGNYDFIGSFPDAGVGVLAQTYGNSTTSNRTYLGEWVNPVTVVSGTTTNYPAYWQYGFGGKVSWLFKWDGPNGFKYK